jgi:steroid delta-isomerase-like uncharacterized protein
MVEANKEVVRKLVEDVFNGGETQLLSELVSQDHISHLPMGDHYGPEGVRIDITGLRAAFPDLTITIEDMLGEKDEVAYRFTIRGTHHGPYMGVPATGRQVAFDGIAFYRLSDGKSVERWVQYDGVSLLQQIGELSRA